jgi:hypothetical protein
MSELLGAAEYAVWCWAVYVASGPRLIDWVYRYLPRI